MKKRLEQYIWTKSSKLKPEPIIDVKIHPNIKPAVFTVYRGNDRRNFDVHNPFNFRSTELDELGPIIEKKKNKIVGELMISLGKRYERLKKIPEEVGIQSALPTPALAQSQFSGIKKKHINWSLKSEMFFIDVFGDDAFQRMSDINKVKVDALLTYLVIASKITTPDNTRFYLKLRKLIEEHHDQEKL
ncbi:hypothetical protein Tco_1058449 [Tanacetum coccineum]|uniref:Uncharacterized protein n=1 Tax=Tanacetum coccineum TaxID=301880 RepID=A0ABQ5H8A8_9ASTR